MGLSETIGIDFVGNAAGLQDAVLASQRALQALNRDTGRISFTLGRVMRTIVTPIASTILAAFAAKKALADFTKSSLPGAFQLNQAYGFMQLHLLRLSEAVGQLLAPAAERAANVISRIAQFLEPLIRKLTATIPSIAAFMRQLGQNFLDALRPLMPTVFAFVERLIGTFKGIDWSAVLEKLHHAWNVAWAAILKFMAPIIIRIATLIETAVKVGRDALASFANWFSGIIESIAAYFGITLPGAVGALDRIVAAIQTGIIVGIAALQVGLQNLPLLFEAVAVGATTAFEFLRDNWEVLGQWMIDSFMVVAENIGTLLVNAFAATWPAIQTVFENIWTIGKSIFFQLIDYAIQQFYRLSLSISAAIIDGVANALDNIPTWALALVNPAAAAAKAAGGVDALRRAAAWFRNERDTQFPGNFNLQLPELKAIPGIDWETIFGSVLKSLPGLPDLKTNFEKMQLILDEIRKKFGPGIAALLEDALKKAPDLAARIIAGLPNVGGVAGARVDRFDLIGPLLFGSREAAMRESNQASKNPLVPLAQQANQLSAQQLVVLRAQQRAAARKARMANF